MKQLLEKAKEEIIQLRKYNEILSAQIDIVNIFAAALGLKRHEQGMTLDIVWEINNKLNELRNEDTVPNKDILKCQLDPE